MTMPRPSLVTSSGPSPVRGFMAAIRASSMNAKYVRPNRKRERRTEYPAPELWIFSRTITQD